MQLTPLDAQTLPLNGKHLIEASAGTGKTFNITRIYLRLLLERELSVEQILVMTFTKDATEEIKSRIGNTLRHALANWYELAQNDSFYQSLAEKVSAEKACTLLRKALLFLDDAAIFTIHGFCKRVLSQYAFDSGLLFNLTMESNCQEQTIEAVQDWYRQLAKIAPEHSLTVSEFWPEPLSFIQVFGKVLGKAHALEVQSKQDIAMRFKQLVVTAKLSLLDGQNTLFEYLVDNQKGAKRDERIAEFNQLIDWLTQVEASEASVIASELENLSAMPANFIDGRRFGRSPAKAEINEICQPVNLVKKQVQQLSEQLRKAEAYQIVADGIGDINRAITEKKQKLSLLSFDDLIEVLANKLTQTDGQHLAAQLLKQYPAAMIDEFQDTDPHQFNILKAIYQQSDQSFLTLIGDPKQAIYGFRGGDIFTYLAARQFCQYAWVMDTNWRSNAGVLLGYNRLFYGTALDESAEDAGINTFGAAIPYHPVKPSNTIVPLKLNDNDKALQFVYFNGGEEGQSVKPAFRAHMATWLANKIVSLLSDNRDQLSAADIAILVRDGTEADIIKQALSQQQIASVYLSNRSNLWLSEQASQLILVLKGILYFEQDRYFNAALASGLLGFTPESMLAISHDEQQWQSLKYAFKALREDWEHKGFISAALKLLHNHIQVQDGQKERALTNIMHLFELLQSASSRHHQPLALLHWFEQQQQLDVVDSEAELRLESDENLIKIVTQHGSKGLEYPVVFVPFASRHKDPRMIGNRQVTVIEYHNQQQQLVTALAGDDQQKLLMAEEAYAESVRLLYVAVTRAAQRCYLMVAPFDKASDSPLGKTLGWQAQQSIAASLDELASQYPQAIGCQLITEQAIESGPLLSVHNELIEQPSVAKFTSKIERNWWLSSFTALSRNIRHGGVSLPDRDMSALEHQGQSQQNNMRFDLVKGAQAGNLLHDIMELTDFESGDWHTHIEQLRGKYAAILEGWKDDEFHAWLTDIVNTQLATNLTLNQLKATQQLKEQEFYFPMTNASAKQLTDLLLQHRQRINPLQPALSIKLPAYQQLKGMMHGFIDLVFEHQGKYYVCDYKSSHLGNSYLDYQWHSLYENISKSYYDLQYLIYSLALHRLLKARVPDYDAKQHFGGVYYLYLRGMSGKSDMSGKSGQGNMTTSITSENADSIVKANNNESEQHNTGVFYSNITGEELATLDAIFAGADV
ncbi:exodeoxyribonuclease V subunit beta [Colwellia sp. MEBiC06753]